MMHRTLAQTIQRFDDAKRACRLAKERDTITKLIAQLGVLLSEATLFMDVSPRVREMHAVITGARLPHNALCKEALAQWARFCNEQRKWAVMVKALDQRIGSFSMMSLFYAASHAKDARQLDAVLGLFKIDSSSVPRIARAFFGKAPRSHGRRKKTVKKAASKAGNRGAG